jgi:hypothetical protein
MKKLLFSILFVALIVGCSRTPEEIKLQIKELKQQETTLKDLISSLKTSINYLDKRNIQLDEDVNVKKHLSNGGDVKYVLELEFRSERQGLSSLSISKQMKDAMNAMKFSLPVDKSLWDNVSIGQYLNRKHKGGSFWMSSSGNSSYVIKVLNKRRELK